MSPVSGGRTPKKSRQGKKPPWAADPITDAALALLPKWVRWNGAPPAKPFTCEEMFL